MEGYLWGGGDWRKKKQKIISIIGRHKIDKRRFRIV